MLLWATAAKPPPRPANSIAPAVAVRQHNDGQRLMLMSYPNLFENYGQCVIGIGLEEAPWLNHMGNLLVQHMGEAVFEQGRWARS